MPPIVWYDNLSAAAAVRLFDSAHTVISSGDWSCLSQPIYPSVGPCKRHPSNGSIFGLDDITPPRSRPLPLLRSRCKLDSKAGNIKRETKRTPLPAPIGARDVEIGGAASGAKILLWRIAFDRIVRQPLACSLAAIRGICSHDAVFANGLFADWVACGAGRHGVLISIGRSPQPATRFGIVHGRSPLHVDGFALPIQRDTSLTGFRLRTRARRTLVGCRSSCRRTA